MRENATANCRVLNTANNTLYPLDRVDGTQRFEARVGDTRVGVSMEDPFILNSDARITVMRWRYFLVSPDVKFEKFKQEAYLTQGRASFGEFLLTFSASKPPNYEQHIASFQDKQGGSMKLYCMTTLIEADSNKKKILLKKEDGRYYRSLK